MAWQLQDAKQQFSRLVDEACEQGPQVVTRNGREVVVVMSMTTYREMTMATPAEVLLAGPIDDDFADDLDGVIAERRAPEGAARHVEL